MIWPWKVPDEGDDQHVHGVRDERVDLVGLLSLVVLAVHDGDVLSRNAAVLGQVAGQLGAVQGHEVVGELIDRHADLRRVFGGRDAAQRHDQQGHHKRDELFHGNTPLSFISTGIPR